MPRIRLFKEGTHNGLIFGSKEIDSLYRNSTDKKADVPIVLGHPKNDLPQVGKINSGDFELYDEGGKKTIGFKRASAEISEDMLDFVKTQKHDKISIRITSEGNIGHIGLVEDPAVLENKYQDFDIKGDRYFDSESEFDFDKKQSFWEKVKVKMGINNGELREDNGKLLMVNGELGEDKEIVKDYDRKVREELEAVRQNRVMLDFEKQLQDETLKERVTPKIKELVVKIASDMMKPNMDFETRGKELNNLIELLKGLPKQYKDGRVVDFGCRKESEEVSQFRNDYNNITNK